MSSSISQDNFKMKEKSVLIESSLDIMKISLKEIIDCQKGKIKLNFRGNYYNKLVDNIINNFEQKEVQKVKLNTIIEPLEINSIEFRVFANLNSGDFLKITGSSDYFSNWKLFKNLEFLNEVWILKLNKFIDKDFFALYEKGKFQLIKKAILSMNTNLSFKTTTEI